MAPRNNKQTFINLLSNHRFENHAHFLRLQFLLFLLQLLLIVFFQLSRRDTASFHLFLHLLNKLLLLGTLFIFQPKCFVLKIKTA